MLACGYCGEVGGCASMGRGQHHWSEIEVDDFNAHEDEMYER